MQTCWNSLQVRIQRSSMGFWNLRTHNRRFFIFIKQDCGAPLGNNRHNRPGHNEPTPLANRSKLDRIPNCINKAHSRAKFSAISHSIVFEVVPINLRRLSKTSMVYQYTLCCWGLWQFISRVEIVGDISCCCWKK